MRVWPCLLIIAPRRCSNSPARCNACATRRRSRPCSPPAPTSSRTAGCRSGGGIASAAVLIGRSPEFETERAVEQFPGSPAGARVLPPGARLRACCCCRSQVGGRVLGLIEVEGASDGEIASGGMQPWYALADVVAAALDNAEQFARLQQTETRFRSLVEQTPAGHLPRPGDHRSAGVRQPPARGAVCGAGRRVAARATTAGASASTPRIASATTVGYDAGGGQRHARTDVSTG